MSDITNNEMVFVLTIFKSPETQYNANSIAKLIGISRMGALKIAKRLEKERIISSKEMGKASFYKLNIENDYVRQYIIFLLKREAEHANPYVKVWVSDIKKIKSADAAILFGSILRKLKEAGDIDVVIILDAKKYKKVQKEIEEVNKMSTKKIHPLFQTKQDFVKNIKKGDKPLLNAIKGIYVFGEDLLMGLMQK